MYTIYHTHPFVARKSSKLRHSACPLLSVSPCPTSHSAAFALVMATFNRSGARRKPMPVEEVGVGHWLGARTQENMMISFSRPWNPSTVDISMYCSIALLN